MRGNEEERGVTYRSFRILSGLALKVLAQQAEEGGGGGNNVEGRMGL